MELEDYDLTATPLMKRLLPTQHKFRRKPRQRTHAIKGPILKKSRSGNPDLAVLKAENQTQTHVTPTIAMLAQGLVTEQLVVLGPPPTTSSNNTALAEQQKAAHKLLWQLITAAKLPPEKIKITHGDQYPQSPYLRAIKINHINYDVR